MINKLSSKNVIQLVTGNGLSQILIFLLSPILTRIYSPLDFGKLAIFMSSSVVLSVISTGGYDLAIMLPKSYRTSFNLFLNVILLAFFINLLFAFLFILIGNYILNFINYSIDYNTLVSIPIGSFLLSCFQGMNYMLSRSKLFNVIAYSRFAQGSGAVIFSIFLGLMNYKENGLIIGYIIGLLVSIFPVIKILWRGMKYFSSKLLWLSLAKYKSFPFLVTPTNTLSAFAVQAPVYFISKIYDGSTVGAYSLANRIVTAPVGLISGSISQVYFQRITNHLNSGFGNLERNLFSDFRRLLSLSIGIFIPLIFYGSEIFEFLFGESWKSAGEYVEIISCAMMIRFVVSPLSSIFIASGFMKIAGFWQVAHFFTTIAIFYFGKDLQIESLLWIHVFHEIILYLFYFFLILYVTRILDRR